ncbi:hypothetical protein SprV_0702256600 [Sparganum proliferum]
MEYAVQCLAAHGANGPDVPIRFCKTFAASKDSDVDKTGSEDELHGDINTNMTAPSLSPVHFDDAKGPANDVQTAENRGMLNEDRCIIIQGLPESSASAPRERVAVDLEQFQKLLNEMLQPTEGVTLLKAFRLGSRTNALRRRYHDP